VIWIIAQPSRQARNKLAQSGVTPFMATRIRPRADSHSTTHSAEAVVEGGPNNSRKLGAAEIIGVVFAIRFFNLV
jgi:hypothetical protein